MFIFLLFDTVKPILSFFPIFLESFTLGHRGFQILGEDFFLSEVGYLADTIIRQYPLITTALLHSGLSSTPLLEFILFFFAIGHEFLDVVYGVEILFFVFLTAWAIHKLMLRTRKVLDDSFDFWLEVSLGAIELEMLDILSKILQVFGSKTISFGLF